MSLRAVGPLALALLGLFPWPLPMEGAARGDAIDEGLAQLDAADPETFAAALARLEAEGAAAVRRALEGFEELDVVARRARARLLLEVASVESLDGVFSALGDPDPQVRALLAQLLGDLTLADARAAERVQALARGAASDADRGVRAASLEALTQARLPGTASALERLLDEADDREAPAVAEALRELAEGRRLVVTRVQAAFAGSRPLERDVLAVLLEGYGRALAELPDGGLDAAERVPLVLGVRHADAAVQRAAWFALRTLLMRLLELAELERAERVLAALGDEGLPRHDLLYRRIDLALSGRGAAEEALSLARALEDAAELAPREDAPTYRFYALHFQGAALFAMGSPAAGRERFAAAARQVQELLEERVEHDGQELLAEVSRGGGLLVERLQLLSLLAVWQAACFLAEGVPPSDARVLELCRGAHVGLLRAQVMERRQNSRTDFRSFDAILERDLAPGPLVLFNRKLETWDDARAYGLLRDLGRALATVVPWEFPGFEALAATDDARRDPVRDRERFELFQRIRAERLDQIERDLGQRRGDEDSLRFERRFHWEAARREQEALAGRRPDAPSLGAADRLEIFRELLGSRTPSFFALSLSQSMRQDGLSRDARELGERMLGDLELRLPGANDVWTEWASARVELMIGSALMDEDQPGRAETVARNAVRRLEEIENTIVGQVAAADAAQGTGGEDPARSALVQQIRNLRANALLSLAVNANVRMGDTERALGYFERAFELDQRDFMQVLYACYRARSGRVAEARAVLDAVRPSPPLYYNLACTHALLGDTEIAIDYLQRELAENHPSPKALARQKAWAAGDPDLVSLREHARFRALVAPAPR